MNLPFIKNLYFGQELSEDEIKDIPNPRAELHFHVMYKNLQVGCILGGLIGAIRGYRRHKSLAGLIRVAVKGQKLGCVIMAPAAPVMTEAILQKRNASDESIYDRCYRIRSNNNQVRVDRHATYLALAGGGLGSIAKIGVTNGLLMGFTVGTVTTGVLNSTLWKDKDLKKPDN
eukprot:14634.XXX_2847_4006_1 [CDS] Oithona nana genome sequencing.